MATQRQAILAVARAEGVEPGEIKTGLANGTIVIPYNPRHKGCRPTGIGLGLRTKVNANIGTSQDFPGVAAELKKLEAALAVKTDAVMDLSTGGNLQKIRQKILAACPVPLGTVPLYQMIVENRLTPDEMFAVVEEQAREGVDFMTIHCGITHRLVRSLNKNSRLMGVVSRGGAVLVKWIREHQQENPFYEQFDRLLEIAGRYDVTLSLGDGLRPGSVFDAGDRAQIGELKVLGQLTKRAWAAGVQVMIEGPGHVPLDQIADQVLLQKKICHNAPFYVLGPLPTDVAAGYDHITSAIGGAIAAAVGADFLCYVTPTEHLGLPTPEDVREGVVAARIAGHCADLVKGIKGAKEWDLAMSKARKSFNWSQQIQLAIDPEKAKRIHSQRKSQSKDVCSMCGKFCAMKIIL